MRAVLATQALGWLLAASPPVYAQLLPIPVAPPLPTAPLPISDFQVEPAPSTPDSPSESRAKPGASLQTMLHASSEAEREALLRSRLHESWYGWQTLTVDATAVGILLLGAATTRVPAGSGAVSGPVPVAFAAASAGVYALGPSVVHFAHGNLWRGFGSIGLRVIMPLAGFALGCLASATAHSTADGTLGGVVGSAGAMAADAGALGWDRWIGAPSHPTALFSVRAAF